METLAFKGIGFNETVRKSLDFTASMRKSLTDNLLVNNLNFLGANLRTEIETPGGDFLRRKSRKQRRPSFFKRLEPYQEPKAAEQLTLREKAQIFRERFPEKWKKRMMQREEERQLSMGVIEAGPAIRAYVEAQIKRLEEKKQLEAKRRLLPRTLTVELKYNTAEQVKANSGKGQSDVNASELYITVIKGKNLFNNLPDTEERSEKCCVKAVLFPDGEKGDKNKSSFRFLTTTGTTCWEHKFTFPWCTPETMRNKYIIITVSGLTRAGDKKFIGMSALVGAEALIHIEGNKHRKPLVEETTMLEQTLAKPDEPVFAQLKLYQKHWSGMKDITYVEKEPLPTGRRGSVFTLLATSGDDVGRMTTVTEEKMRLNKTDSRTSLGIPNNNSFGNGFNVPTKVPGGSLVMTGSRQQTYGDDSGMQQQGRDEENDLVKGLHRQNVLRRKRDSSAGVGNDVQGEFKSIRSSTEEESKQEEMKHVDVTKGSATEADKKSITSERKESLNEGYTKQDNKKKEKVEKESKTESKKRNAEVSKPNSDKAILNADAKVKQVQKIEDKKDFKKDETKEGKGVKSTVDDQVGGGEKKTTEFKEKNKVKKSNLSDQTEKKENAKDKKKTDDTKKENKQRKRKESDESKEAKKKEAKEKKEAKKKEKVKEKVKS